jgi:hypothetical protein
MLNIICMRERYLWYSVEAGVMRSTKQVLSILEQVSISYRTLTLEALKLIKVTFSIYNISCIVYSITGLVTHLHDCVQPGNHAPVAEDLRGKPFAKGQRI